MLAATSIYELDFKGKFFSQRFTAITIVFLSCMRRLDIEEMLSTYDPFIEINFVIYDQTEQIGVVCSSPLILVRSKDWREAHFG